MSATLDGLYGPFAGHEDGASAPAPWLANDKARAAAALVLFGGLLAGSSALLLPRAKPEPVRTLTISVGTTTMAVPSVLLRTPTTTLSGPQSRLDLVLSWPSLTPMAQVAAGASAEAGKTLGDTVAVTILPADDSPAPESRMASLYGRFLAPEVADGPGGLMTRRFRQNSPYAGEVLVFSPPDGRRIMARCEDDSPADKVRSETAGGKSLLPAAIAPQCIAEIRRHGLDVQFRFAAKLADGLDAVQARLIALVDRLVR